MPQPARTRTPNNRTTRTNAHQRATRNRRRYATDVTGAIIITRATDFQNAIEKAKKEKPRVRVVCFGHYQVTKKELGAATYDVMFSVENGERKGRCNCAAGTPPRGESGKPLYEPQGCYHLMAAIMRHMQLALDLRAASAPNVPAQKVRRLRSPTPARLAVSAARAA